MPFLAAVAFAAVFWFTDNAAASIVQLWAKPLVSLTVPHLVAASILRRAFAMAVFELQAN